VSAAALGAWLGGLVHCSGATSPPRTATGSPEAAATVSGRPAALALPRLESDAVLDSMVFPEGDRAGAIRAESLRWQPEFEVRLAALEAPSFAWGLVVDSALVASGARGTTELGAGQPVSTSTVYRIGSITKVFTALAILELRDHGQLSLDDPVLRWLPELGELVYPSSDSAPITLRQLLTHSSGLPRLGAVEYWTGDSPPSEAEFLATLRGFGLEQAPGLGESYSNLGASLLGPVVTHVSGRPFQEYLSEQLLKPLGMQHTVWDVGEVPAEQLARPHAMHEQRLERVSEWRQGAAAAAGGLYSSVEDLARWISFQLAAWPASSRPESSVLRRSSVREAHTLQVQDSFRARVGASGGLEARVRGSGLGWAVTQNCRFEHVVWHNGGTEGHSAVLYFLPDRGVGVVILANRADVDLDRPAQAFLEHLDDAQLLPRRRVQLVPEFRSRVEQALQLGQSFTKERYHQLFAPVFVHFVPDDAAQGLFQFFWSRFGSCTLGDAQSTGSRLSGRAELRCDGRSAWAEATLSAGRARELETFRISPEAPAAEAPQRCTTEAAR
jgi:CubicO group peptidase (beta-lactamase class C family)